MNKSKVLRQFCPQHIALIEKLIPQADAKLANELRVQLASVQELQTLLATPGASANESDETFMERVFGPYLGPSERSRRNGAFTGEGQDQCLTKKELAGRLKMTVRTVENWQRKGVLPFLKVKKVVLFYWPDVLEHLKANFSVCRRNLPK